MDWTVNPGSRISRLPRVLRYPALVARNVGVKPGPRYVYESDGLATAHFSPFLEDPVFTKLYDEMVSDWFVDYRADVRWRMWLLTALGRQCESLRGNFAEFGVYRAGCAFMLLATTAQDSDRKLFLFDTFAGMPGDHLTDEEEKWGLTGRYADTSVEFVEQRLSRWQGRFTTCPGDVFDTVRITETGPLVFAHIDLNSGEATLRALEYVYERLVAGGIVLFDDYGSSGGGPQRDVIGDFFEVRPEEVIVVPTGQAFVIKHAESVHVD
jgi:hypothetical protein